MLLNSAVLGRRDSHVLTENVRQVGLARKSTLGRNLNNRELPEFQEGLRALDSTLKYITMRRDTYGGAKHFKKMRATIARFLRERG